MSGKVVGSKMVAHSGQRKQITCLVFAALVLLVPATGECAAPKTQPAPAAPAPDTALMNRMRPWESLPEVESLRTAAIELSLDPVLKRKFDGRLDEVAASIQKTLDTLDERDPIRTAEAATRIQEFMDQANLDLRQLLGRERADELELRVLTIKVQCIMLAMGPSNLQWLWDRLELAPQQREQIDSLALDVAAEGVRLLQELPRSPTPGRDMQVLSNKVFNTRHRIRALLTAEQVRAMDDATGIKPNRPATRSADSGR